MRERPIDTTKLAGLVEDLRRLVDGFEAVDRRLAGMNERLGGIESSLAAVNGTLSSIGARVARQERLALLQPASPAAGRRGSAAYSTEPRYAYARHPVKLGYAG